MNDTFPSIETWSSQSPSYSSMDQSFEWQYGSAQSSKAFVSNYNNLLQRAADFYATLDNLYDSKSSTGSDRSSPERRVSNNSMIAQVRDSIPDRIERRREQNRSSQRAYRRRKEQHQKELEDQIAHWQHKHQMLSQSYNHQSKEVSRLKTRVDQLNTEISSLKSELPTLYGSLSQSPQEFDLVPFFDFDASSTQSTPKLHNTHPSPKQRR